MNTSIDTQRKTQTCGNSAVVATPQCPAPGLQLGATGSVAL